MDVVFSVIPAEAGIQPVRPGTWIPACAGMTGESEDVTGERGRDRERARGGRKRPRTCQRRGAGRTKETAGVSEKGRGEDLYFPSFPPPPARGETRPHESGERESRQTKMDMALIFSVISAPACAGGNSSPRKWGAGIQNPLPVIPAEAGIQTNQNGHGPYFFRHSRAGGNPEN
jgi:hypothetical protein